MTKHLFHSFTKNTRGAVLPAVGIAFPVLIGAVGLAVDVSTWTLQREELQSVADAAAVAAALEFGTNGTDAETSAAAINVAGAYGSAAGGIRILSVAADPVTNTVSVRVTEPARYSFAGLFGVSDFDISADSEATMTPRPDRACVIALDPNAKTGLTISGSSTFTAEGCTLWSNSLSSHSIVVGGSANVRVAHMCASGYTVLNGTSVSVTGSRSDRCANLDDPLANWTGPTPDRPCTARNLNISSQTDVVLSPGTYCGGARISSKGGVTLEPGVYIMDGGPLVITADRHVTGSGVGLYFTGNKATVDITGQAEVQLSASATGSMAGIVLASDRTQTQNLDARIAGGATVDLVGAVYLPTQTFTWRGNSRTADPSKVTQIIAAQVDIAGTSSIILEADFEAEGLQPVESFPLMAWLSR